MRHPAKMDMNQVKGSCVQQSVNFALHLGEMPVMDLKRLTGPGVQQRIQSGSRVVKTNPFNAITEYLHPFDVINFFIRLNKGNRRKGVTLGKLFDKMIIPNPIASLWGVWKSKTQK